MGGGYGPEHGTGEGGRAGQLSKRKTSEVEIMTSPNQLSFLPDDYLERKTQRRTNVICAVLFVIVLVMISLAFTITERSIRIVEKQHTEVEKQYAEAAGRLEQVKQMQEKQRTMAHQAELTASLLEI